MPVAVLSRVEPTLEIEIVCDGMSETYTFAEFPVRIGRDESCELHLERPFVSRKHARLERGVHGGFVLVDEGGRNGVALGGLKLARDNQIELVDGAEFTIETLVAKVHIREADEKATSLYGEHVSGWQLEGGRLHVEVQVPGNTSASAVLPSSDGAGVLLDGAPVDSSTFTQDPGGVRLELSTGRHTLSAPYSTA